MIGRIGTAKRKHILIRKEKTEYGYWGESICRWAGQCFPTKGPVTCRQCLARKGETSTDRFSAKFKEEKEEIDAAVRRSVSE